jgi:hypothetical protein
MKSRSVFAALFALVFAAILSGCAGSASIAKTTPSSPTKVSPTAASPTTIAPTTSVSSGSSGADNPAASAKGYFDALYSGIAITQFMCSAPAASISTLTHYGDSVTATLNASKAKFDVSGLKYETANLSGDSADVSVTGKVTTISAAGTSTSSDFPSLTLTMKNDNGWKICGLTTP